MAAQSKSIVPSDILEYMQYNNLRKDVLDAALGHRHTGAPDGGYPIAGGSYQEIQVSPTDDHGWSGNWCNGISAESVGFGEVLYYKSNGTWAKIKLDSQSTSEGIAAISLSIMGSSQPIILLLYGSVRDDSRFSFTKGAGQYASASVAGALVELPPSTPGQFIRQAGFAFSEHVLCFQPESFIHPV